MAYSHPSLNLLGPAGGTPKVWVYSTPDAMTVVRAAGYFNAAANELNVGDLIICNVATGGTTLVFFTYVVSNSAGVVDVVDGTQIAVTDTD